MTVEKRRRRRTVANVRQSLSHGRSRTVQVEVVSIAGSQLKLGPQKKRAQSGTASSRGQPAAKPAPKQAQPKKADPPKKKSSKRSRKPSFFNSIPKAPPSATVPKTAQLAAAKNGKQKKPSLVKRAKKGSKTSFVGVSAGLPGYEHVDPPTRSSSSTPAERWLRQIGRI